MQSLIAELFCEWRNYRDTANTSVIRAWRRMERIAVRGEAHLVHANLEGDDWTDDFTYAMLNFEWHAKNAT